ncbi:MAG: hypothetical protein KBH11_13850, partial [Bacteroidia bacterium]|nr:hypothetical protein [Bacteroidia bacterium]
PAPRPRTQDSNTRPKVQEQPKRENTYSAPANNNSYQQPASQPRQSTGNSGSSGSRSEDGGGRRPR